MMKPAQHDRAIPAPKAKRSEKRPTTSSIPPKNTRQIPVSSTRVSSQRSGPTSSPRRIPAASPRRIPTSSSRRPPQIPGAKPSRATSSNPHRPPSRAAPSPRSGTQTASPRRNPQPRQIKNVQEKKSWRNSFRSSGSLTGSNTPTRKRDKAPASPGDSDKTPTLSRRVSGFSLIRRFSNTPKRTSTQIDPVVTPTISEAGDSARNRHVSGSGPASVETPSAVNGATPIISNSPPSAQRGTTQENNKPVKSGTRLVKGRARKQGSERFLLRKKALGSNDSKNNTFPRNPGAGPLAQGSKPVPRGYDVKPVNRSPRTAKRSTKQVWPRGGTSRTAKNPSKLSSMDLDKQESDDDSSVSRQSEKRQNPSGASDMALSSTEPAQTSAPFSVPVLSTGPLQVTIQPAEPRHISPIHEVPDFTSPRILELRQKLGRKEAAFADHLKLLDTHLTDAKGKLGSMTARTEPATAPPPLELPKPTSFDSSSESDSDSSIPDTPTAAPVFGPVAMFSVPTLTLGRAKTFIREETQAGAAEIDYMEDARQIVERLKAQRPDL